MRLIKNTGNDRVIDQLKANLTRSGTIDAASSAFSLFAFAELRDVLLKLAKSRLVLPVTDEALLGGDADRRLRNQLQTRWLALECLGCRQRH